MNLRAIANSITRGVNPNAKDAIHKINDGFTIIAGGKKVAKYIEMPIQDLQVQECGSEKLYHLNLTAQQGMHSSFFANGLVSAQVRSMQKGEDYLVFRPANETQMTEWRVVKIERSYDDGQGHGWVQGIVYRGNNV